MSAELSLLTFDQAAQRCGLKSAKCLRQAAAVGELAFLRLGSGPRSDRIHPSDLAIWWGTRKQCRSNVGKKAATKLPLDTAEERCADLLGIGRTQTRGMSKRTSFDKSARLTLVKGQSTR